MKIKILIINLFLLLNFSTLLADVLTLNFSKKDLTTLELYQKDIIDKGYAFGTNKNKVKIEIFNNKKAYTAKINYDGGGMEHFRGKNIYNRSLNFKIGKKKYLNIGKYNYKNFRLVDPNNAYNGPGLKELMFADLTHLLKIPYRELIPVTISLTNSSITNQEPIIKNLMVEEKYDDDFLERNFLRQGIILERVKLTDDFYKMRYNCELKKIDCKKKIENFFNKTEFKVKNTNVNEAEQDFAIKLLKDFYENKKSIFDTFELNNIANIIYLSLLWNETHFIAENNIKFYFSPITKKFKILVSDPFYPLEISSTDPFLKLEEFITNSPENNWVTKLFNDDFSKLILFNELTKISSHVKLDNLFLFYDKKKFLFDKNYFYNQEFKDVKYRIKSNKIKLENFFIKQKLYISKNKLFDLNNSLIIDHDTKTIKIETKFFNLNENVNIIDQYDDYTLIIENQNFLLEKNMSIVSNLKFKCFNSRITGTQNNYLFFFDNINNYINNCSFKNINNDNTNNFLTGAVTFYNTNLNIADSEFHDTKSEDLINIVDSTVNITNSTFYNSYSDAVDFDNSQGIITKSIFQNCGNDCIDFSHSNFSLKDISILRSYDKSVSIGEDSEILINNIKIKDCGTICIAVKDQSLLDINESSLANSYYGISTYVKKKVFNEPKLIHNDIEMMNININFSNEYRLQ